MIQRQSTQLQDEGKVLQNQKVLKGLDKGETVIVSQYVTKYTNSGKELPRILVITNRNLYNVVPEKEKSVTDFFKQIFSKSIVKRKIGLNSISGVTISMASSEFVFHIPSEYDQRYKTELNRDALLTDFCEIYTKNNLKKLPVYLSNESSLLVFTTTTHDLKKKNRKLLPSECLNLEKDQLQAMLEQGSQNEVMFQKTQTEKPISLDDFKLIKVLGKGAFGKVMLCQKKDNSELYAVKAIKKCDILENDQIEYIKTERKILEQISHPFLVSLEFAFQTKFKLYFVMKFMRGGELFTHLRKHTRFNEEFTAFYAAQILIALEYLHSFNFLYRDLKPENILMDETGYVALTDYGLAKIVSKNEKAQTVVGTAEYLAPEIILQQGHSLTVDWWSYGILIYEMLVGKTPFYSENRNTMFKQVLEGTIRYPNNVYLTEDAQNIISMLLKRKPKERLGFKGADEIKKHPFFKNIDFDQLLKKQITPPIIPELADLNDLKYFNSEFTESTEIDSPDEMNDPCNDQFGDEFYGMTYNPNKKL